MNRVFLQIPPGRRYVRSFLFSRRIDAPLANVHLIARVLLVLCLSGAQLRTIDTSRPDPIGAFLFFGIALLIFFLSGMNPRLARLYLLLTLPALTSLFTTWVLFNPVPGRVNLLHLQLYSGQVNIGLALWEGIWLLIVGGYFLWTRKIAAGFLIATLVTIVVTHLFSLPTWTITRISLFHPLMVLVSDRSLLVAITKVLGYAGMVLTTVALVVTSRDTELMGALRQVRVPQPVIFFLSTVFRALELAWSDYETIRLAQLARAINARPRSFLRRLRDLGSIAVPMVAMMIRRASEIGDALTARGYSIGDESTDFYETSRWKGIDWAVLALSLIFLLLAFYPQWNLSAFMK